VPCHKPALVPMKPRDYYSATLSCEHFYDDVKTLFYFSVCTDDTRCILATYDVSMFSSWLYSKALCKLSNSVIF